MTDKREMIDLDEPPDSVADLVVRMDALERELAETRQRTTAIADVQDQDDRRFGDLGHRIAAIETGIELSGEIRKDERADLVNRADGLGDRIDEMDRRVRNLELGDAIGEGLESRLSELEDLRVSDRRLIEDTAKDVRLELRPRIEFLELNPIRRLIERLRRRS